MRNNFSQEPPLDAPDAPYYIDVLAVIAGLMHGPFRYFVDKNVVSYSLMEPVMFAGAKQAINYLREYRFGEKTYHMITYSRLVQMLELDTTMLLQLVGEDAVYDSNFAAEGVLVEPEYQLICLLSSTFCLSAIRSKVQQICSYQTQMATHYHNDIRRLGLDRIDVRISNIDASVSRLPNASIAAYTARASFLAGNDRWIQALEGHGQKINVKEKEDHNWMIRTRRIEHGRERKQLLKQRSGLTDERIQELTESGLIAFDESELLSNNLQSFAMDGTSRMPRIYEGPGSFYYPNEQLRHIQPSSLGIYLVDKYYQEIISLEQLQEGPIYRNDGFPVYAGESGLLVREILEEYGIKATARAKWWDIPCLHATNRGELIQIVETLSAVLDNKGLLFRGQTDAYRVPRSAWIRELLFGNEKVDEIALTSTASRHDFDFDHFLGQLQLELQSLIYCDIDPEHFKAWRVDKQSGQICFTDEKICSRYNEWLNAGNHWDVTVMSIAQHYGVPTHGIDLSTDLEVAIWMALNEAYPYKASKEVRWWYRPVDRSLKRPVIYLVAPMNTGTELSNYELSGLPSERQRAQSAHMHFGGWGMHTNLCAEEVLCAITLGTDVTNSLTTSDMYPSPSQDPLFDALLELRRERSKSGQAWGYERITLWQEPES